VNSLLNKDRPPVFCSGCSHDRVVHALDKAFQSIGLTGDQIAIVSDIGCSGLFDTFFHTHAMHGLHGRALTYAAGIKLARPALKVVATMGDGGLGIGGAHLLSAFRRNLDITLLVLNNFNFGMTGGQFSVTTPVEAQLSSGFLNQLEHPMDVCRVATSAGAAYVSRCSSFAKDLPEVLERAIQFEGFSLVDIWGVCTGRYLKRNRLSPKRIADALEKLPPMDGPAEENIRKEYARHYREKALLQDPLSPPALIEATFKAPETERQEILILGAAGQRILTAGEIICFAGMTAGLNVTQKNEYNITVLRGPSISEVILSPKEIGFTEIKRPTVILALSEEGIRKRNHLFKQLDENTLIIQPDDVGMPDSGAKIYRLDFKGQGVKNQDYALAGLSVLAKLKKSITLRMLRTALEIRFQGKALESAKALMDQVENEN
jgi:2-oxoglutarate ferredoxin oxidoreductase subunit beta